MRVWTKVVSRWDEELERYVTVEAESEWYEYDGLVDLCKGPSANQEALEASQTAFYNQMIKEQEQTFGEQQAILSTLKTSLEPIIKAGPGQYGYTKAEDTALRTQAKEGTAAYYKNAAQALNENIAARGGGDSFIPSGAADQLREEVATSAAAQEASQNLAITNSGYDIGRQQYNNAIAALSGNASIYNPVGYSSAATGAGSEAYNMAKTNQDMRNAGSFWNIAGGILGGAATAFGTAVAGPVGGELGNQIAGAL